MKREILAEDVTTHAEARVVHEDVDRRVLTAFLSQTFFDAIAICDNFEIAHHFFNIDVVAGAEVLCETRKTIGVAGDQHEVDTPLGEFARESGPDTRGAAGDEGPMHGLYDTLGAHAHAGAPIL